MPSNVLTCTESDEVLKLLLNARSIIASRNPVGVQNNVTFIVDLDALDDPEDLLSDDLGVWEQTKTRSNGEACNVTKVVDKLDGSHQVCRRPYINKSDRSPRKTVVNVIHPEGRHHNLVFVKYHPILLTSNRMATPVSVRFLT